MPNSAISYAPRPDATPEAEISVLTSVYTFILNSAKKSGRSSDKSGPDDAKEIAWRRHDE